MLGTGWFGAVAAEVGPGKTVAVVGDGAVGLLAVLAAKHLGAERIIAMSRHEPRQKLASSAQPTSSPSGDEGVAIVKELTNGLGAHSVIEAVGTQATSSYSLLTWSANVGEATGTPSATIRSLCAPPPPRESWHIPP